MAKKERNQKSTITSTAIKPPVVAILGHVDHGKTTLLDYIRKSRVAEKEFGGITQHIGAYQIEHKGHKITFVDTPGHEAFSGMRARGGQVADIAILVVAADDGVMPQTKESIAHIKAADIPFIVAINKMDLPGVNLEKVKKQLAEADVLVEGYGGDVVSVPISAKTGQGVDELLEMVNLVAEMEELKADKKAPLKGVVIEAKLDKFRGPVATVLIKEGTLAVGDEIFANVKGKVKSLFNSEGKILKEAGPADAVEVLGFSQVPKIGELVSKESKEIAPSLEKPKLDRMKAASAEENEIRLIVKADAAGSLEAILNSLEQLKGEEKILKVYYSETGDITEGDVLLAAATRSLIIGFNVGITASAERLASEEKVLIRKYNLIYELLDELKEGLESLAKKEEETALGEAEILQVFKAGDSRVAGCTVKTGRINKADTIVVKRGEREIGRSKIASMKQKQSDIGQANEGEEFGLIFEKDLGFTKGDIIVAIGLSVTKS